MTTLEAYNFGKIFRYYVAMALALSLCASLTVMDLLLLKMGFDLTRFGLIKGQMFLIPSIAYFALSGWIKRLHADVAVCLWSYFLRAFLPLILPVAALLTQNESVLLWTASAVIAASWSCAMFANNTLLKIMRTALPVEKLNANSLFFNALLGLPGFFISIPAVWFLTRFGSSRTAFLVWFTVLQTGTLLCEIPGILALRRIRCRKVCELPKKSTVRQRNFFSRDVVFALLVTVLHGLWMGLLSTYFVIYLIRKTGLPPAGIVGLDFFLATVILTTSRKFGKVLDQWGYPVTTFVSFLVMALVGWGWGTCQTNLFFFVIFVFFIHNGNSGVLAMMMRLAENTAVVKLVPAEKSEFMMGLSALLFSVACFLGCAAAGPLYVRAGSDLARYFLFTAPGGTLIFLTALVWLIIGRSRKTNDSSLLP